ncbi:MAG: MerR family transcriptional regulator [Pseudomonadota bacterium]
MELSHCNIASVESETGLSKDVLRVWERRYGFPSPIRDAQGIRLYSSEELERLRVIKHLMEAGHRPGKLINQPLAELLKLMACRNKQSNPSADEDTCALNELLELIRQHDAVAYQQAMLQRLARQGLQSFIEKTVAPLSRHVGECWAEGRFEIFEEHLFTELTQRLLRQVIANLPTQAQSPRILLTSLPDEQHMLGLLMAEALFTLEGASCIPLGTQMPIKSIARAASAQRIDIVALSFSRSFPQRQIPILLQQLRSLLSDEIQIWVGGNGTKKVTKTDACVGVHCLSTFTEALSALSAWRQAHSAWLSTASKPSNSP